MSKNNEITPNIMSSINKISEYHIHGSLPLLKQAIEVVITYTEAYEFSQQKKEEIIQNYSTLLKLLIQSQPQMAAILTFCNNLLYYIDSITTEITKDTIQHYCLSKKETIEQNTNKIASYLPSIVKEGSTIYTYSSSSTLTQSLIALKEQGVDFSVVCSESRPKNEGIIFAETLQNKSIPTTLVTDAYLFSHCSEADLILIGTDSIQETYVINKIGTLPLINMATLHHIPTYVLCTSDKIIPQQYTVPKEQSKPQEEITKQPLHNVTIVNTYFDTTPLKLFTGIITEDGIQTPKLFQCSNLSYSLHRLLR